MSPKTVTQETLTEALANVEAPVKPRENVTLAALKKQIEIVILAAKTLVQSSGEFEKKLHEAARNCVFHAHDHGDAMPALHLLEGLPNHEVIRGFRGEVMAYIKAVSPIHFYIGKDGGNAVRLLKQGETGFKPFNLEEAETPFYERKATKDAREAAFQAATKSLTNPLGLKDLRARIFGLRKTFEAAQEKDRNGNIRGVADGEKTAMKKVLDAVEEAFREAAGKKGAALEKDAA